MTDLQIDSTFSEDATPKPNAAPSPARDHASVVERVLGLTAALTLTWCCMVLTGAHPQDLVTFMPIALVTAIVLGGLIMSHGPRHIAKFLAVCFGAAAANSEQAEQLRSLCSRGRRLAYSGACLQMLTSTIHMLSVLDDPTQIGPAIALSMTAFVYAILISAFVFGPAKHWVAAPHGQG